MFLAPIPAMAHPGPGLAQAQGGAATILVTEDGDTEITEAGDTRVTE